MRSREVGQSRQTHYLKNGGSNPPSATSHIVSIMALTQLSDSLERRTKALTAILSKVLADIRVY